MKKLLYLIFHFKFRTLLIEDTEDTWIQLFRSLFVGGVATIVDFGVAAVVREGLGGSDLISNSAGFVIGLVVNYLISILWVFKKHNMNLAKEFIGFTIIGLIGLAINTGIVVGLGKVWNSETNAVMFYVAKIIATFITLIWNFAARKIFLYKS